MPIQFLDMRVSNINANDEVAFTIPEAPGLLFGDIGLQVNGALPANSGDIRVSLNGYARVSGLMVGEKITIKIFRDLITPIFVTSYIVDNQFTNTFSFNAVDFRPAVLSSGQIRYIATIETDTPFAVLGAANFSGIAVAGSN